MDFFKFVFKVLTVFAILMGGAFGYYYFEEIKVREELKKECVGETCSCVGNIIDYRLTKNQAKTFLRYLRNRKERPDTKILEFTDFDEAKRIMEMFRVCQLEELKIVQQEKDNNSGEAENSQEEMKTTQTEKIQWE